jgi:GNAT superfamily N-acetyltransferase
VPAAAEPVPDLRFRDGTAGDLTATFELSERAMHEVAARQGVVSRDPPLTDARIRADWLRHRSLIEFIAAQPEGRYVIAETADGVVGYARTARFDRIEQLTELMVDPGHQVRGVGRALLERCWPGAPSRELGRVVVASGAPNDLTLYTKFGVMPVGGHWHMRARAEAYLFRRSQETDAPEPAVHVLKPTEPCTSGCASSPTRSATTGARCTSSSHATGPALPTPRRRPSGRPRSAG